MSKTRKVVSFLLCLLLLIGVIGCGKKEEKDKKEEINFDVKINDVEINFPCTLEELKEAGVIINEEKLAEILETPNKEFNSVEAVCEDTNKPIYFKMQTGKDSGESNVRVIGVMDLYLTKRVFQLQGELSIGSTVDNVIKVYGENYEVTECKNKEDLTVGIVFIDYVFDEGYTLSLRFSDGLMNYIDVVDTREKR